MDERQPEMKLHKSYLNRTFKYLLLTIVAGTLIFPVILLILNHFGYFTDLFGDWQNTIIGFGGVVALLVLGADYFSNLECLKPLAKRARPEKSFGSNQGSDLFTNSPTSVEVAVNKEISELYLVSQHAKSRNNAAK